MPKMSAFEVNFYYKADGSCPVRDFLDTLDDKMLAKLLGKAVCVPGYIAYVLVCVYALNGARGFLAGFWQMLVILSVMNLMDRFLVDDFWVGHTKAWTIPGTEDLKPYITARDKAKKWLFGTVGMAVISAALAAIMMLFMKI